VLIETSFIDFGRRKVVGELALGVFEPAMNIAMADGFVPPLIDVDIRRLI